jgi:hypothetical protein
MTPLNLHWLPLVENGTIDALRVADIHQRGAFRPTEAFMFVEISRTLQNFGAALTWLGDENEFGSSSHQFTARSIAVYLSDLAGRAKIAGASEVLLPLRKDTPLAKYVDKIGKQYGIEANFSYREESYNLDLSACGPVNRSLKDHPLQIGRTGSTVRGLWDIDQSMKDKWDNEPQARRHQGRPFAPK